MQTSKLTCCVLAIMVISLLGCDIDAEIDAVNEAEPFESIDFDVTTKGKINKNEIYYSWDFGDGSSSTKQNPKHIYSRSGDYDVNLRMIYRDSDKIKHIKKTIKISKKLNTAINKKSEKVLVKIIDREEQPVENAIVQIENQKLNTNKQGVAIFDTVKVDKTIITAKKGGFLSQSMQLQINKTNKINNSRTIVLELRTKENAEIIRNINNARSDDYTIETMSLHDKSTEKCPISYEPICVKERINGELVFKTYRNNCSLNSLKKDVVNTIAGSCSDNAYPEKSLNKLKPSITYNAGSFMLSDGQFVKGIAKLSITSWNPTSSINMRSFPAHNKGINQDGYINLRTYGALNINLTQNGDQLQLKPGKLATINIPLSLNKYYDGKKISVGDKVPLWYLSENLGAWIIQDEREGEVVLKDERLILKAKISHLGTWSWSTLPSNPLDTKSIFVQCYLPNGRAVSCSVESQVNLQNKTYITYHNEITANGENIKINSNTKKINYAARYFDYKKGLMYTGGQIKTLNDKHIKIILTDVKVVNNKIDDHIDISCQLKKGVHKACHGQVKVRYFDKLTGKQEVRIFEFDNSLREMYRFELPENKKIKNIVITAQSKENRKVKYYGRKEIDLRSPIPSEMTIVMEKVNLVDHLDIDCQLPNGMKPKTCNVNVKIEYLDLNTGYTVSISRYLKVNEYHKIELSESLITNLNIEARTGDRKYAIKKIIQDDNGIGSNIYLMLKDTLDNINPDSINVICVPIFGNADGTTTSPCRVDLEIIYRDLQSDELVSKWETFIAGKKGYKLRFSMPSYTIYSIKAEAESEKGHDKFVNNYSVTDGNIPTNFILK